MASILVVKMDITTGGVGLMASRGGDDYSSGAGDSLNGDGSNGSSMVAEGVVESGNGLSTSNNTTRGSRNARFCVRVASFGTAMA